MKNITIRDAVPGDAADLAAIYAPYVETTAITFEYDAPSAEEFRGRIEETLKKYPYIVAELDGRPAGYAYAGPFSGGRRAYDWSSELTVYVDRDLRKSGIGGRLYAELTERLRAMGITNLYACIAYPEKDDEYLTQNSAQFHEHLGFKIVGKFQKCGFKFNRWYDMIWMEKIIGDHVENQPPVRFGK